MINTPRRGGSAWSAGERVGNPEAIQSCQNVPPRASERNADPACVRACVYVFNCLRQNRQLRHRIEGARGKKTSTEKCADHHAQCGSRAGFTRWATILIFTQDFLGEGNICNPSRRGLLSLSFWTRTFSNDVIKCSSGFLIYFSSLMNPMCV